MEQENKKDIKQKNIIITKKAKIWLSIIMAVVIVISFFCGFFTYRISCAKKTQSLQWVINMIDRYGCYYDEETGKVVEFTEDDYINMITGNLDKYSDFYTKQEYVSELATSKGNNYGIGVSFSTDSKTKEQSVYRILWNSSADKAGVKEGDIFVGVYLDGERVDFNEDRLPTTFISEISDDNPYTFIINRKGTEITFDLKREVYIANYVKYYDNEKELRFISNEGEKLQKEIVDGGYSELDDDTAYIGLYLFEGNAINGIYEAMNFLKERNKKKLILDLRKNGGGFMDVLESVAPYFIESDEAKPVVAVALNKDNEETLFKMNNISYKNELEKIVVLANEGTASASECLIGAMLYYGAITNDTLVIEKHKVGEEYRATTYGKGIMQTTYKNVFSGEAIKLTTANVFWPDKTTSIHGVGISTTEENSVDKGCALARAIEILR